MLALVDVEGDDRTQAVGQATGALRALTDDVLRHTRDDCFVMHPGPMNRDVEISSEVADGPRQVILEQVTNGVAVRMAVIYLLSGGDPGSLGGGES